MPSVEYVRTGCVPEMTNNSCQVGQLQSVLIVIYESAAVRLKHTVHFANCSVLAEESVYEIRSAGVKHSLLLN